MGVTTALGMPTKEEGHGEDGGVAAAPWVDGLMVGHPMLLPCKLANNEKELLHSGWKGCHRRQRSNRRA